MNIKYTFTTFEKLEETGLIDPSKPIMIDTETVGLYGKIRLLQLYQRHFDGAMFIEWPNPYQIVALLSNLHCVFHNAHYDVTTVQDNLGGLKWQPNTFDCTFLLSRLHFYTKDGFSLDEVITYVLGTNPYGLTKKDMQGSNWGAPVLSEEQLIYAAMDPIFLHDVWDIVNCELDNINYKLDRLMTVYCLDFQTNGLPFEEDKLNAQYAENMARIKEIGLSINCNSYQQVRPYIGSNMSDDLGLSLLVVQGNERAKDVQETRKLVKQNSFLTKFLNEARDGCIYGKFKCSPRSGRTASEKQNLQQLPRKLKGIFGVDPDGDLVMLHSDFAQIQLRGACVVTGDVTMEKLFRAGEDLHNYVAVLIFGENFTKEQRQICKTANFGLLFGAGITTFQSILLKQAGMWLTEKEISDIRKKWLSLWKQISNWQTEGLKAWKKKQVWETPLGRRYTAKMMTDQLAMQIQGFEAEVAKLATHYMLPKLKDLSSDILLRDFVHDGFIFTAPNDPEIYKPACQIIADAMQLGWSEMSKSVKIQDLAMPTKVRVGYNWGDIEDGKFIYELSI